MFRCLVIVALLYAHASELSVVAIPTPLGSIPTAIASLTVGPILNLDTVAVITSAPALPTDRGLMKREVGNDFCGWGFGIASAYYKCDGTPGLCLYDTTNLVVECGQGPFPTTCIDVRTTCDLECQYDHLQRSTKPCLSESYCITITFPSSYRGYNCIPRTRYHPPNYQVAWSYMGMNTVVHLPRWKGDDGLLSYGTVVPEGVATPTGSFTGGTSLDVTCCDPPSETMSSTSLSSSNDSTSTSTSESDSIIASSTGTTAGSSKSQRSTSSSVSASSASSDSSSSSGKLSSDSIIGLSVGIPASLAGIAGVCVAIYYGRKRR